MLDVNIFRLKKQYVYHQHRNHNHTQPKQACRLLDSWPLKSKAEAKTNSGHCVFIFFCGFSCPKIVITSTNKH